MDVLLIRPPGRFVSLSFPDGPMVGPPRSLLYLAGALRSEPGVTCHVLDALAWPDLDAVRQAAPPFLFGLTPDQVEDRVRARRPAVIGVTCMANYFSREAFDVARAARKGAPDALIVAGGPDPTSDWERYLREVPEIDVIVLGEGERVFAEIVRRRRDGKDWKDLPGLAFRGPDGFVQTPAPAWLDDVDSLEPDYSYIDLERYFDLSRQGFRSRITYRYPGVERTVDVVTSRGCPYPCSFCAIQIHMGRRFRSQKPETVLAHLEMLVRDHGVRHVHFEDDIVNCDGPRFKAILRGIRDRKLPLTWDTPNGLRADLLDAETVDLALQSGCAYMIFGVESGSQRVLDEIVDKRLKLSEVEEAARLCHERGLDTLAFYIIGFPGETRDEVEETYRFAFGLFEKYGTTPILQVWRPYVGTTLHGAAMAGEGIDPVDALAMHREHEIPFTLFRDTVGHNENVPIEHLAQVFRRYQRDGLRGGVTRWLKFAAKHPIVVPRSLRALGRAGARLVRDPRQWRGHTQGFFFEAGVYPQCAARNLGESRG